MSLPRGASNPARRSWVHLGPTEPRSGRPQTWHAAWDHHGCRPYDRHCHKAAMRLILSAVVHQHEPADADHRAEAEREVLDDGEAAVQLTVRDYRCRMDQQRWCSVK